MLELELNCFLRAAKPATKKKKKEKEKKKKKESPTLAFTDCASKTFGVIN